MIELALELILVLTFVLRCELHHIAGGYADIGAENGTGAGTEKSAYAGTGDSPCTGAEDSTGGQW